MKSLTILGVALLQLSLSAGELDPKLLRIISPETRFIYGIDLERYRSSRFSELYPVPLLYWPTAPVIDVGQRVSQLIIAMEDQPSGPQLMIFQAAVPLSPVMQAGGPPDAAVTRYKGIPIVTVNRFTTLALLDATIAVAGDEANIHDAIDRWKQEGGETAEIASKVRQLSRSYDNWFLVVRPLAHFGDSIPRPDLKNRDGFMQLIEEVRGGIRFGGYDDVGVEAVVKTAEDASALAALGRWIPGIVQMEDAGGLESALADLIENLVVRADGRTVSSSFSIPESKLEQLVKSRAPRGIVQE